MRFEFIPIDAANRKLITFDAQAIGSPGAGTASMSELVFVTSWSAPQCVLSAQCYASVRFPWSRADRVSGNLTISTFQRHERARYMNEREAPLRVPFISQHGANGNEQHRLLRTFGQINDQLFASMRVRQFKIYNGEFAKKIPSRAMLSLGVIMCARIFYVLQQSFQQVS